jgi:hypothetical protein
MESGKKTGIYSRLAPFFIDIYCLPRFYTRNSKIYVTLAGSYYVNERRFAMIPVERKEERRDLFFYYPKGFFFDASVLSDETDAEAGSV